MKRTCRAAGGRSTARALPLFGLLAVATSIVGACADWRRSPGEDCLKDQDCLSGVCLQLRCAATPPYLDARVSELEAAADGAESPDAPVEAAAADTAAEEGGGNDGPIEASGGDATVDATRADASVDSTVPDAGTPDASADARIDAPPEASADAAADAPTDSSSDAAGGRALARAVRPGDTDSVTDGDARGVLLEVAYDGTAFHGWAAQNGPRTVAETLRGAVIAIDPRAGPVRGASRTDAGVHADGQVAAFDTSRDIAARGWVLGLNRNLPDDVAVRAARTAPCGFAPRFVARGKRYRYRVLVDSVRDPRWRTRAWRVPALDVDAVAREAEAARGTHDFAGFRASGDERASTVRVLTRVDVEREDDPRIVAVVVEGNAFLYNMVRILVGTMVDVGRGRLGVGAVARALEAKNRGSAGTTAPAHGLVLERVELDLPAGMGERWPR